MELKIQKVGKSYKFLMRSILFYSFPCLNSFSKTKINKKQVI